MFVLDVVRNGTSSWLCLNRANLIWNFFNIVILADAEPELYCPNCMANRNYRGHISLRMCWYKTSMNSGRSEGEKLHQVVQPPLYAAVALSICWGNRGSNSSSGLNFWTMDLSWNAGLTITEDVTNSRMHPCPFVVQLHLPSNTEIRPSRSTWSTTEQGLSADGLRCRANTTAKQPITKAVVVHERKGKNTATGCPIPPSEPAVTNLFLKQSSV